MSYSLINNLTIKEGFRFTFLIFLFVSCNKVENPNQVSYEALKQLEPTPIEVVGTEILNPTGLDILKSGLLIIESDLESEKFKLYDTDEYQFMGAFGVSGRGPDQYSEIINQPVSTTSLGNTQLYDWVKKRLQVFDISVGDEGKINHSKNNEYIIPPELMLSQYSAFINDSIVVSSGGLSGGLISFTNVHTDQTKYFNPLDYDLSEYEFREKSYVFESYFGVNNEDKLIAVASKFIPELHVVNFKGEIVAKADLPFNEANFAMLQNIENMESHFYGITTSNRYIYASYVGKSFQEMNEVIGKNKFQDVNLIKLYKFDWEGDLVDSFVLSGGLYRYLSIDEKSDKLYSINAISSNPEVVFFDMK